ncbi:MULTISPECIES: hypothetical protein [Marichromatium]|uniref:Uncharacterized protein n=1 Tax=Marichromatium gracile TaxID=1048 RepID=A0A4R4AKE1_MARGR|nr:hypothetical protein [Marichromatium gracile]MBK1707543.1 hypothetical protein [Marichromatium gracile]TCW39893.1 hypothetical protein EDC29_101309 [Marichromatium gracile]
MDSISIDLKGSTVDAVEQRGGQLRIHFSRAYQLKTMTGSRERTRWWQAGTLVFDGADETVLPPPGELCCSGGELEDNLYVYRDMIPVPFESRGRVGCSLEFEGLEAPLVVRGEAVRLELEAVPRYIEHLRPETG